MDQVYFEGDENLDTAEYELKVSVQYAIRDQRLFSAFQGTFNSFTTGMVLQITCNCIKAK